MKVILNCDYDKGIYGCKEFIGYTENLDNYKNNTDTRAIEFIESRYKCIGVNRDSKVYLVPLEVDSTVVKIQQVDDNRQWKIIKHGYTELIEFID